MPWDFYASNGALKTGEYLASEFPIGTVIEYAGTAAPTGWLLCDGSTVSRGTYSELYNVVGTNYGAGDGSSTFKLPDASGKIIYAQSLQSRAGTINAAEIAVGTIVGTAAATAPNGWLLCDGSTISRTTYAELYAAIGTEYGAGDGATTFVLPDAAGFMIFAKTLSSRIRLNSPPQYVTSLPGAPVDGQEVYLLSTPVSYATPAATPVFHARYNLSANSWQYVGPANLAGGGQIQQAQASKLPYGILGTQSLTTAYTTTSAHWTAQDEGLAVTASYAASRYLKITAQVTPHASGGTNGVDYYLIRGSTQVWRWQAAQNSVATGIGDSRTLTAVIAGPATAATETFKLQISASTNNTAVRSYADAAIPRSLTVEDIGPQ